MAMVLIWVGNNIPCLGQFLGKSNMCLRPFSSSFVAFFLGLQVARALLLHVQPGLDSVMPNRKIFA